MDIIFPHKTVRRITWYTDARVQHNTTNCSINIQGIEQRHKQFSPQKACNLLKKLSKHNFSVK